MARSAPEGQIWAWGWQAHGQCGHGEEAEIGQHDKQPYMSPKHVAFFFDKGIKAIATGYLHSAVITQEGHVWSVGSGRFGVLGHGNKDLQHIPKQIAGLGNMRVRFLASGTSHMVALMENGDAYSWGCGYFGRLALGDRDHRYSPAKVRQFGDGSKIRTVACGGNHTMFVLEDGSVWGCGYAMHGQLGTGYMGDPEGLKESPMDSVVVPQRASLPSTGPIIDVSCGEKHTVILAADGEVYTTGNNDYGQLGTGSKKASATFQHITGLHPKKIKMISAGMSHNAVLAQTGEVYTWGRGEWDQLGNSSKDLYAPKIVENISRLSICEVWTFGSNKYGQLGRASEEKALMAWQFRTPKKIPAFRATDVCLGGYHTLALIQPVTMQLLQHAADGNDTGVERLAGAGVDVETQDGAESLRPLHWAAQNGHASVISILIKHGASLKSSDANGNTALHYAAAGGHVTCVTALLQAGAEKDATNSEGRTPLHQAIQNRKMPAAKLLAEAGANLETLDSRGKRPLDFCTFEEGFPLKVLARRHDVFIIHDASMFSFVKDLAKGIEKACIKCYDLGSSFQQLKKEEYSAAIAAAKGVIFVVSASTAESPACTAELVLTKELGKIPLFSRVIVSPAAQSLFPIWREKIQLSGVLESTIYRQQLVDFSDPKAFTSALGQLNAGLRNQKKAEAESEAKHGDLKAPALRPPEKRYVVISHHANDESCLQFLRNSFPPDFTLEIKVISSRDSRQVVSAAILHCWIFIVILSPASLESTQIRDHIALAENHRKLIFPALNARHLQYDPAMLYTFAQAPKYDLSDPTSQVCIDNAQLLVSAIIQNDHIAALKADSDQLTADLAAVSQKVSGLEETLVKIRKVIPIKAQQAP